MARLHVDRLSVHSFYGRPFTGLNDITLGDGVTVIYGPNGQGKTTLARAVQGTLWPETVGDYRPSYDARFRVGDDDWTATFDAGAPIYARTDGRAAPGAERPDGLPDAHHRDRYCLSLRDLLTADGQGFAAQVLRDAAGGVDLSRARQDIGARPAPPRSTVAATEATDAEASLRALRAEHTALRADEERLDELGRRAESAGDDAGRAELFDLLVARAAARTDAATADRAIAGFPAALEHVGADTGQRYRDARAAADRAAERLAAAETAHADATAARDAHDWTGVEVPETPLLLARLDELKAADRDLQEAAAILASETAREAKARAAVGDAAPIDEDGAVPRLDAAAFDAVKAAADDAARADAAAHEGKARVSAIKNRIVHIEPRDTDVLRQGISALRTWLAFTPDAEAEPSGLARTLWIVAVVLLFAFGILAVIWHPAAAVGLVGVVALALVAHRVGRPLVLRDDRPSAAQRTYGTLELQAPREWEIAHVEARLSELEGWSMKQVERVVWRERLEELTVALDDADGAARDAATEAERVAAGYGLRLDGGPAGLVVLAGRVLQWQDASTERAAAAGRHAQAVAVRDAALVALSKLLRSLPCGVALDAPEGAAHVEAVRTGTAQAARLAEAADRAAADLRDARATRDAAEHSLLTVLRPLEMENEPRTALDGNVARLSAQIDAYTAAVETQATARALWQDADRKARAHALWTDAVGDLDVAATARLRDEARTSAGRRDEWLEQAARVRERLDAARAGHALEDAVARHDAALASLETDYDAAADALVASALADWTDESTRDEHLPAVFGVAREHLLAITSDRIRLSFDAEATQFRAVDVPTGRVHALDELSSGTRLQLLLAVRLAFAEHQERSVQLPILLDEALANSDDGRADAIAQSILDLAKTGRQVIYFTAQAEEVAKWQRLGDCTVVTLPTGAPTPEADALPAHETTRTLAKVGQDETLDAYAARIGMPAWGARDRVAALPLHVLLDRAETLRALLEGGYETWGQLLSAMRRGAAVPVGDAELGRVTERVQAVEAWREAWQIGRGKPVDRAALVDSGAVSERYLDELLAVCDGCEGDAERLLAHVRSDAKGFRAHKADELEVFLTDAGYLVRQDTLSDAELRRRATEAVTDPLLALDVLRRLRAVGTPDASPARDGEARTAAPVLSA